MTATPATRSLTQVLLTKLAPGDGVRLLIGEFTGASSGAYATIRINGAPLDVPILKGVPVAAGRAAYMLATKDFLLCIGTVAP